MSVIETLTEGIRARSLANEGEALLGKWEKTGLLEGLDDQKRGTMSRLLENQAAQLLKETTTMQAGDVEGFAAVAFPIVRRVFGNLLAQDLVSVQPMSLPSGLIFFMDFVYSPDSGMTAFDNDTARLANVADKSLYGGDRVGRQITSGSDLTGRLGERSFYSTNNGFSSPTGSDTGPVVAVASGTYGDSGSLPGGEHYRLFKGDPALVSGTSNYVIGTLTTANLEGLNKDNLVAITVSGSDGIGGLSTTNSECTKNYVARRLTTFSSSAETTIMVLGISEDGVRTAAELSTEIVLNTSGNEVFFPLADSWVAAGRNAAGDVFGAVAGSTTNGGWNLENQVQIPEIDIKVDSVAVTAITKKLKAKWTPELAQDLNAYHNLDAEVELTSILSEQIALEIDQEILQDLIQGAKAATLYWSRLPGRFVNRETGANQSGGSFTGTVSEWYETLLETVNEVSARIHRKTLRGGANFIVTSPEVANILEFTSGFRASAAVDDEKGNWGVQQVGSISRKMDIYVDPYFLRNLMLVGRKGSSFLESGYVYAPYVPLQVTPTIFGPDDFVPRKGVMTRYAKKMVRPDLYGLVVVRNLVE
jgi:hypothetical protein